SALVVVFFSFSVCSCLPPLPPLHSFPTRRSSDLTALYAPTSTFLLASSSPSRILRTRTRPAMVPPNIAFKPKLHRYAVHMAEKADRKSTRLNSSHVKISYAVFCLKKKKQNNSLTQ